MPDDAQRLADQHVTTDPFPDHGAYPNVVAIHVAGPFTWRQRTPAVDVLEFVDDKGTRYQVTGDAVSLLANGLDAIRVAYERAGRFPDEGERVSGGG